MNSLIQSASTFFDRPGFNWKAVILGFSTASFVFESYLKYRQIQKVANAKEVSPLIKDKIDSETLLKSSRYSLAKLKFSLVASFYSLVQNIAFYQCDLLAKLWSGASYLASSSVLPAVFVGSTITKSLFFMGQMSLISVVLNLPVDYYSNFVIEEKYGFNKLTVKLWLTDTIKEILVMFSIGAPVLAGFLKIVDYFGDQFMYYLSVFLFVVQIFLIIIYPKFIQPLFNKLEPLADGELKTKIEQLAERNKFPLDKLYVIDGSKRSSHSNAYFMGLPWGSKQIVIYDTLIASSEVQEVVAVLGHEIGHWFLSHTTKLLLINQAHIFGIFTLFAAFINNKSLYQSFGFYKEQPVIVGFLLFGDILKPVDTILEFAMNLLSRKYEYQADRYAVEQGYAEELKVALITLHKENLSSLDVDWLFSAYNHSHPHLLERLSYIDLVESEKSEKKQD
ncbi:hypothetical protein KL930_003272 [Ogataea haglerorum]|uniref:CAAX prenyl protease n=1 Tax=Ogataea haglerorum TaxID=1937702 RepID=A0AAN6D2Y8_9ASCO|nr:uncharacterized protein KL911_002476 [Ogataea haglerorum]KAG7696245.1 hypothetical protein KL915_002609 [Ogataea haglerorum]KAG7696617.1 hypothetical protein KL951_003073 [Ogataea haglerorum]KAG7708754.1 hypothetical protein KL950_002274 [Ogataea haglerorum]KAG7716249.1 hypothetical protein KL913_003460 [Ogataea haglerorum]KAG7717050.1 hypothetical protein KL949_003646 [Ogataea haglerorum]